MTGDAVTFFGGMLGEGNRFTNALVLNEKGEHVAPLGPYLKKGRSVTFSCAVVPKGVVRTSIMLPAPNLAEHGRMPEILLGSPRTSTKFTVRPQAAWAFLEAELYRCSERDVRVGQNRGSVVRCMSSVRKDFQEQWAGKPEGRSGVVIGVIDGKGVLSIYVLSGIPTDNPEEVAQLLKA